MKSAEARAYQKVLGKENLVRREVRVELVWGPRGAVTRSGTGGDMGAGVRTGSVAAGVGRLVRQPRLQRPVWRGSGWPERPGERLGRGGCPRGDSGGASLIQGLLAWAG